MYKIFFCVVIGLCLVGSAYGASMTIVDLPAIGTDAAIDISPNKTYTHAFDFGSNAPAIINGVAFDQGPTGEVREPYVGVNSQGYGYTIDDTRTSVRIYSHAGNDPSSQADGDSAEMLRDMLFPSSADVDEGIILTLSDLTPEFMYSVRYYFRYWDGNRPITFRADGESDGVFSDIIDIDIDQGGAHYLDYTFAADSNDVTMEFITNVDNQGVHLYGITCEEIGMKGAATRPSPAHEATDVFRDTLLTWTPGESEDTHNVYFDTNFDDVNDGVALVSPGQDTNSYNPGRLEFDQTYFWRVDEVNATEGTIYTGALWSFTVEPFDRAISAGSIIATASSQAEGQGPENTINESGLVDDLHSTEIEDMWTTAEGQALPAWIQYEFDKTYKLHEMLLWNYNGASFLTLVSLQDVMVEYSTDGVNWILNDSVSVFNKAPGAEDYAADTIVPFGDVPVRYVKITAHSNWSGGFTNQCGLSEVRFMHIPVSASEPIPDDGATEVAIDVTLGWRAGREAAEHNVYISADEQAVIGGTVAAVIVGEASYGPLSLDLASTYYWRVDEVNNANTVPVWEGGTWSFTTCDYLVVDDFESYNDIPEGEVGSNLVYAKWIDGVDNPSVNGSTMGYFEAFQPSMETTIIHGGSQSAPVMYDNSVASFSEVTVSMSDLPIGRDWTVGSPALLTIWFYGDPNNAVTERMYVKLNGIKKVYDGDAGDITMPSWTQWDIELSSFGINLGNVTTLTIGFDRTGVTGGSGMVFIDDIRLYRSEQ